MTREERDRQFQEQLYRNQATAVNQLLNDPQYADLRKFYEYHYDEVEALLRTQGVRQVQEAMWAMEPYLKQVIDENMSFLSEINNAIKNGIFKRNIL